jgi:predicted dehydrogenase
LRIGLIGCGRWGANIARDLQALNVRLEIADPVTGAYSSLHDLPACDGYVVATPTASHAGVLDALLPYGRPIFCEKPLATNVRALEALPESAHQLVFVMDKWRYHPAIEELGRLATAGALGALYGIVTRRLDAHHGHADVDCTWILLPHELAIATEILGCAPVAVAASASLDLGYPVALVSHLRAGDAYAVSTISTRWPTRVRAVEVAFAHGIAAFCDDDESALVLTRAKDAESTTLRVPFVTPLRRELEAFVANAAGLGPPPKCSFADGLETVRTIERLRELAGIGPDPGPASQSGERGDVRRNATT